MATTKNPKLEASRKKISSKARAKVKKSTARLIKEDLKRNFGGTLTGFKSKEEANFQKKHLKAYLKGCKMFRDGYSFDPETKMKHINWFPVIEIWK